MDENTTSPERLCDESKCVSRGLSFARFDGSFTCYGDETGEFYPMMCADGYLPQIVDSAPPIFDIFPPRLDSLLLRDDNEECEGDEEKERSDNGCNSNGGVLLRYFTCCPPVLSEEQALGLTPQRHCSDPILISSNNAESTNTTDENATDTRALEPKPDLFCSNGGYSYQMKTSFAPLPIQSYVCCDTPMVEHSINFLNDDEFTECVPYHDKLYTESKVMNVYGRLHEILCGDIAGDENDVWIPKPMTIDWEYSYDCDCIPTAYQCCKIGPSMLPFVEDAAFRKTVYPLLTASIFAMCVNMIFFVALAIPLVHSLISSGEGSSRSLNRATSRTKRSSQSSQRSSGLSSRSSGLSSRSSRVSSRKLQPTFNAYNLYMMFMVIPELVYLFYVSYVYGSMINNNGMRYNPYFTTLVIDNQLLYPATPAFAYSYGAVSKILNAFIAWEVMTLLKNSHERRRVGPPPLKTVCTKAMISYAYGVVAFAYTWGFLEGAAQAAQIGDFAKTMKLIAICRWIHVAIAYVLTNAVIVGVCVTIWWRGYLSPIRNRLGRERRGSSTVLNTSRQEKAMRELAWYFTRIIVVFYVFWLPAFHTNSRCLFDKDAPYCAITGILVSLQPVLSTLMAMTKSDVREYVIDLLTLSYLRSSKPDNTEGQNKTAKARANDGDASSLSALAIGSAMMGVDGEASSRSALTAGSSNNMKRNSISTGFDNVLKSQFLIPEGDEDDEDEVSRSFLPPPKKMVPNDEDEVSRSFLPPPKKMAPNDEDQGSRSFLPPSKKIEGDENDDDEDEVSRSFLPPPKKMAPNDEETVPF